MKKPENFNAAATVKKQSSNDLFNAINGNFSRNEPAAANTKTTAQREPALTLASTSTQPQQPAPAVQQTYQAPVAAQVQVPVQEEPKKVSNREVKEKFLVSMSKGERSIFKSFCALQNVSMNHFVMCAMDYFKEDLENGKVTISAHSYKRKDS